MQLDLGQLRMFREVVHQRSRTRAAARLHVTQSAVSHALRRLEENLGQPLFERKQRSLVLTEAGAYLFQTCERIFREVADAEEYLGRPPSVARTRVTLGATVEFGTMVLARQMRAFVDENPDIQLDLHFSHDLVHHLLREEIDLAVDCRVHPHPSVESIPLFRETWAVVASSDLLHRHAVRSPVDLGDVPVLSMDLEADWWTNFLQALPAADRPVLRRVTVLNHVRGIINATLEGVGVGFVPRYSVVGEIASGALVPLFPALKLLEDHFRVFQKRARATRKENRAVVTWLRSLDISEYGDTIEQAQGREG